MLNLNYGFLNQMSLKNLNILITRPAHQAEHLSKKIQALGAHALGFPTIAISPSAHCEETRHINTNIAEYDIALFVSQNAVQYAFQTIDIAQWPKAIKIGVIGKGSAECIHQLGLRTMAMPNQTYNSEGLLNAELLQHVRGKKIVIFRGQAGRNLLGDSLIERGAFVDYCEVYRRGMPDISALDYDAIFKHTIDTAIFTSSEGLIYAFKMLTPEHAKELLQTPWLLISERMKKTAYNLGHNSDIIIAQQASDDGIISSLKQWATKKQLSD